MSKVKIKTKDSNFSVLQILGSLFLIFAVADFAVSWMGINLTPFMGSASRFSPIIFGVIGSVLINMNNMSGITYIKYIIHILSSCFATIICMFYFFFNNIFIIYN